MPQAMTPGGHKTVVRRTYDPVKQECRVVMGNPPYEVHRSFGLDEVMNLSQTELDSFWNRVYTEMGEEWEAKVNGNPVSN